MIFIEILLGEDCIKHVAGLMLVFISLFAVAINDFVTYKRQPCKNVHRLVCSFLFWIPLLLLTNKTHSQNRASVLLKTDVLSFECLFWKCELLWI